MNNGVIIQLRLILAKFKAIPESCLQFQIVDTPSGRRRERSNRNNCLEM